MAWQELAVLLIPVIVPGLIALLKLALPSIPRPWLPLVAPVLGAAIQAGASYLADGSPNPLVGAVLGSAGVGIREIYDQLSGNAAKASAPPPPVAPPKEASRLLALCLLPAAGCLLLVSACAAPQVSMPSGTAAILYAHAYGDYTVARYAITAKCRDGKLDEEFCAAAKATDARVVIYANSIENALMNPTQPIDWDQVLKYTREVAGLLIKLGVMP